LQANTLLTLLKLDSAAADRVRQTATFQQVKALVESSAGDTFGPIFKTKALLALAESRLRSAEPLEAEDLIAKAMSFQRRDDGTFPATLEVALAKLLRGIASFQRGQGEQAIQLLSECRSDMAKVSGPGSAATSLSSLNLALALERLGRDREALVLVNQAEPALRQAMGTMAPTYLRAKGIQDRLERENRAAVSSRRSDTALPIEGASRQRDQFIDFFG
jgi:Tetratricopeptide repeat